MKFQVQRRRPGTPQERWRPINEDPFDTSDAAQAWIDAQPVRESDPHPWEYHITEVPD